MLFNSNEKSVFKIAPLIQALANESFGKFEGNKSFLQYSFTRKGVLYSTNGSVFAGLKYNKVISETNFKLKDNTVYGFQEYCDETALISFEIKESDTLKVNDIDNIDNVIFFNKEDFYNIKFSDISNWLSLNMKESSSFYKNFIKELMNNGCVAKIKKDGSQINIENNYVILILSKKSID